MKEFSNKFEEFVRVAFRASSVATITEAGASIYFQVNDAAKEMMSEIMRIREEYVQRPTQSGIPVQRTYMDNTGKWWKIPTPPWEERPWEDMQEWDNSKMEINTAEEWAAKRDSLVNELISLYAFVSMKDGFEFDNRAYKSSRHHSTNHWSQIENPTGNRPDVDILDLLEPIKGALRMKEESNEEKSKRR